MGNSTIALVVMPGQLSKAKGANHPAKLSEPGGNTKSKIPYEGHTERMKLAQMAAQRMMGTPESASKYGDTPVVDRQGREAGGKAPHSNYSTDVSGDDSQAHDNYGRETYVVSPSELGAGAPEGTTKHTPVKAVKKPKK